MKVTRRALLAATCAVSVAPRGAEAREANGSLAILDAFMRESRSPGMQFALVKEGKLVASGARGFAHLESATPVDSHTLFPINSATKPFAGVAVMQMQEQGLVDADAPISSFLADLPSAWNAVTIAQCLSHCSGLPNIVNRNGLIGTGDAAEAWTLVKSLPMQFAPGARFDYNQTNYLLIGRLLAELGQAEVARIIADRQFRPIGMTRSCFGDTFDVIDNSAQPYSYFRRVRGGDEVVGEALSRWVDDMPASLRAGGGIYTTARELASWIIALMDRKILSNPESIIKMAAAPKLANGQENVWALGWPLLRLRNAQALAGIGGGRAAFCIWPEAGSGVIVLTNLVGANPERVLHEVASTAAIP
jgi:CubicO group peptidase (beta-lactamase class C family)